tara:strand:+ start:82 stop:504 length:423 start_codon:yes stop_codon:yes gene_type:complete
MQIQDIGLTQIIVVLIFLGLLILLQQLIKSNKFGIQGHFSQKKRIILVEDLGVSNTERIRIVRIDNTEYVQFTNKGSSPTVIPHETKNRPNLKSSVSLIDNKLNAELSSPPKAQTKKANNILSDAISNARKMNPKLGFKK